MAVIRPSIENVRSLGNFVQSFRWGIQFEKFPAMLLGYTSDDINFRAESTTIPKLTGTSVEYMIRGQKVKQPGIHDYGNQITLTCIETVDSKIANFVRSWREICWQTTQGGTGITQYKSNVEATIIIIRLDNLNNPIWYYKLFGCFLEDVEWGNDLDGQTADPLKPAMQISFDYFNDAQTMTAIQGSATTESSTLS